MNAEHDTPGPIGVVLAGGGARGAYEAGALSVLLPALEAQGQRPTIFVGTSAGAINAVLFAAYAHLPAAQAVQQVLSLWRRVERAQVIRPILPSGLKASVRYLGQLAGLPVRLTGVLDATPFLNTLNSLLDWQQLHDNAQRPEILKAVAVVATACATGRTTIFVEGESAANLPPCDDTRAMDYVATSLAAPHVMASAAIPVLFSPALVETPTESKGWYLDGGVRLNAPIKPAVALGIDRAIIIATDPLSHVAPSRKGDGARPDVYAAIAEVLQATLVDQMVEDVRTLGKINELLLGNSGQAELFVRAGSGKRALRPIPFLFVGPSVPARLGQLAQQVIRTQYGRGKWLLHGVGYPLLQHLLGGSGQLRADLLSYIFFEQEFIAGAMEMGRRDAQRLLDGSPEGLIPWQLMA